MCNAHMGEVIISNVFKMILFLENPTYYDIFLVYKPKLVKVK
jgi:hypothetical protein